MFCGRRTQTAADEETDIAALQAHRRILLTKEKR
jgi:hypothetical protein